jgi:hypothetical protein
LEAEELRYNSTEFKHNCPQYFWNSLYFRSGLYGEQLSRYFGIFSIDQFHIIKYEEFISNPIKYLQEIFHFLGVEQDFMPQLAVGKTEGKITSRYPGVQYFVKTKLYRLGLVRKVSMKLLHRINMKSIEPMSLKTRNLLLDRYSSDLRHLSNVTGIFWR